MLFQVKYDSIGFDKKMIVGRLVVLSAPVLSALKLQHFLPVRVSQKGWKGRIKIKGIYLDVGYLRVQFVYFQDRFVFKGDQSGPR
jgi:hypothetical protein